MKKPRFILGLDPSLDGFGYAILDVRYKNKITIAECGTVRGRNATWGDHDVHQVKLALIQAKIKEIRAKYQPLYNTCFSERGFTMGGQNKSNHGVFKARGAMEVELVGMEIVEFSPSTVKKAVAGDGRADKKEVEQGIRDILGFDGEFTSDNESDAIGVAYTGYVNNFLKEIWD